MVEHHIWLTGEMIGAASRLPDAEADKPLEDSDDGDQRTLRGLLSRFVATCEPARVFTYRGMIAHVLTFAAPPAGAFWGYAGGSAPRRLVPRVGFEPTLDGF